jgi:hypothetical protein
MIIRRLVHALPQERQAVVNEQVLLTIPEISGTKLTGSKSFADNRPEEIAEPDGELIDDLSFHNWIARPYNGGR